MKPGTMTTGWCGVRPASRAAAPGLGPRPKAPAKCAAPFSKCVVFSAGRPLRRCMDELSQGGMACSTRSWNASGIARRGTERKYTTPHTPRRKNATRLRTMR